MGEADTGSWKETIAVNLDSVYYFCDAVVPLMKARKRGWIINVGSTAGIRGEALHSHYAATKGALNALTKSWAVEFAPWNIRVNCVAPGWVDTDMCTEVFSDTDLPGERPAIHPPEAHPSGRGHRRTDPLPGLRPRPPHHRGDHQRQRRIGPLRMRKRRIRHFFA